MSETTGARRPESERWPEVVIRTPLLRGLDERGQRELERAGKLRRVAAGTRLYTRGEHGDVLYVVSEGALELVGQKRGDDGESVLRTVEPGASCGEEASIGASYRASATAARPSTVAEIPVALLRRALERAGGGEVAERGERRLRRAASRELLRTLAFSRHLGDDDLELLLDGLRVVRLERGEPVYRAGNPASELWLVADGMVQLQAEDDERVRVCAYLARGDFFGDDEVLAGATARGAFGARGPALRALSAVASGASLLLAIPAALARTLSDRNPGLLARLRRIAREQVAHGEAHVGRAAASQTQHAFKDLYRLQIARSLLVIDLDSCVRCGHCASACESLHGVARLSRRGDKVITRFDAHAAPLLLPNSCQHCHNPSCMPDCPTGAIGRDVRGEVFIREELCTGCGACAKGCPWDNIQIVPRLANAPAPRGGSYPELAVKCELCRGFDGPACVKACPTEAIYRIDPSEDLPEVAQALRRGGKRPRAGAPLRRSHAAWIGSALVVAAGLSVAAGVLRARGLASAEAGLGAVAGYAGAVCLAALALYSVPKRFVRLWMRRRRAAAALNPSHASSVATSDETSARTRSVVRPFYGLHLGLGFVASALAALHGGAPSPTTSGGGLSLCLWASSALGALAALAYVFLPRRLARLERSAVLPEELGATRRELHDRLYGAVTGRSELVKKLFERVLVPYLRRPFGWLALLVSGRDLRAAEGALRARIDRMLEGRGAERLAGLDELVRLVVELRALGAQRFVTHVLRGSVVAHVALGAASLVLLVLHVASARSFG